MNFESLTVDCVGQDAEGGFLGEVGVGAGAECGTRHAFEAAEERFDVPFEKELSKLGLAGMPAMVGRLLGFCKGNVTTKSVFKNCQLDIERLKALDQLRHDYAHRRTKAPYSIQEADRDLRYLTITAVHLVTCIMEAFGLKGQHRRANASPSAAN